MWILGPIFSKKFSKALREVMEEGQVMGEGKPLYYALLCSQSLSISLLSSSGSSSVPGAVAKGTVAAGAVSATEPPECHCPLQGSLHSSCTGVSGKLNSELWTPPHKRRFVPQPSTSCLHCPWDPVKLTALFRPKRQQIVLILLFIGIFILVST